MFSWKTVQKYSPAPTIAWGTVEKLQTLLISHCLILQAEVIHCSSSPMASAFTCSPVLGQVLNSSKRKKEMLSHPRRSDDFKNIPHLFEGKMDSLMFDANSHLSQMMNEMEDWGGHGGGTREWSLHSVCIQALLLFLASSLEEYIHCDPTPNLSLFCRVQHYQVCPTLKSPALMAFPLRLYPPLIPLSQKRKVKTTYWRNISHMRTVKKWNKLPTELVPSPTLDIFKTTLDKALSNLVQTHSWPYFEGEVGLETSWCPFQPESLQSNDMMTLWSC